MSTSNPLSSKCTARSKRTGQPCDQWVVGGGVCWHHGGASAKVAARREGRVLEAEALMRGELVERRDPASAMLAAAQDADEILQRIKRQVRDGELDQAALLALGDWLDRVARISKLVVDAKLEVRQQSIAEQQGTALAGCLRAIFDRMELTPAQQALIPIVVPDELRKLA